MITLNEIFKRYGMESVEEFNEFYNVMDAIITSVFIGESSRRLYEETGIEIRNCSFNVPIQWNCHVTQK